MLEPSDYAMIDVDYEMKQGKTRNIVILMSMSGGLFSNSNY